MVQPTQYWLADARSDKRRVFFQRWRTRDLLTYPLLGAGMIEVDHVLFHDPVPMMLTQDQDVIKTLAANAPNEAFAGSICLRRFDWSEQHLDI